jgi:cellulose synthase/poly-beta-1,6-N-acetylglucosamine synthase-like glycosyltransferase
MDVMIWSLRTRDAFTFASPLFGLLLLFFFFAYADFLMLSVAWLWNRVRGKVDPFEPMQRGERPSALVIIPSLLRNDEDFTAITTTVESCAMNDYPGDLLIIASVDGRNEKPVLLAALEKWAATLACPSHVKVVIAGTPMRQGKMMAVEAGVHQVQEMLRKGELCEFPPIYFSIDGDGTLGKWALERLVDTLTTPHFITGRPRRVVAGKCCIRPELFWQGWTLESVRQFFTVEGQIYRQVAREFIISNVPRFNLRPKPQICIPGGLYCTWSPLLVQAPRYMGFMRSLSFRQYVKWWFGGGAPSFTHSDAAPIPEALTGPSDDTCISFLAQMATWKEGKLVLDPPRSPMHSVGRLIRSYFFERTPGYCPEGRVYTYTPTTLNGLWIQRVRWNASRFECSFRFKNSFAYHWEVGLPMSFHWLALTGLLQAAFYYAFLPIAIFGSTSVLFAFCIGYFTQALVTGLFTLFALGIESERRRFWPVIFGLPFAPAYSVSINFLAALTGVTKDLFLFGNDTKFAPEWTFIKGGTVRIALLFRARRFLALSVRALVVGDVPFGSFWWGWTETKWTPSGYAGWTTGKKQRILPPMSEWFGRNQKALDPAHRHGPTE